MRTFEEYQAQAMLLGMKFSRKSWTMYRPRRIGNAGLYKDIIEFYHPDTMELLNPTQVRRRREWIEIGEDPDAVQSD